VLVVSEVDRVHPILHPLLRNDIEKQAGRLVSGTAAHNSEIHTVLAAIAVTYWDDTLASMMWIYPVPPA
jgi:hypothetical protein